MSTLLYILALCGVPTEKLQETWTRVVETTTHAMDRVEQEVQETKDQVLDFAFGVRADADSVAPSEDACTMEAHEEVVERPQRCSPHRRPLEVVVVAGHREDWPPPPWKVC